jgi:hypothetical protein
LRSDATAVRTIWARAALRDLEDAYASGRDRHERLNHRIVEHSIRFGVLSRFTAFVAVDPERTDVEALDEVVQPVEPPSGWATPTTRALLTKGTARGAGPRGTAFGRAAEVGTAEAGAADWSALPRSIPRSAQPRQVRRPRGAPATRPLDEVLRALERLLADPDVDTDALVAARKELVVYRDGTRPVQLSIALAKLCEAIDAYIALRTPPTDSDRQSVAKAVDAVRAVMATAIKPPRQSSKNFWE